MDTISRHLEHVRSELELLVQLRFAVGLSPEQEAAYRRLALQELELLAAVA